MGFIRANIDYKDDKYIATLYFTWLVYGVEEQTKEFDSLRKAKKWILEERTYNKLTITDSAMCKIDFSKNKTTKVKNGLID